MYRAVYESTTTVERLEDGSSIPLGSGNIDEQHYLEWVQAGGKLLPAIQPDPAILIKQRIRAIEQASEVGGPDRMFMLATAEDRAQQLATAMTAAGKPTTAAQLLSTDIMYRKVKAVDDQIKALEAQLPS